MRNLEIMTVCLQIDRTKAMQGLTLEP